MPWEFKMTQMIYSMITLMKLKPLEVFSKQREKWTISLEVWVKWIQKKLWIPKTQLSITLMMNSWTLYKEVLIKIINKFLLNKLFQRADLFKIYLLKCKGIILVNKMIVMSCFNNWTLLKLQSTLMEVKRWLLKHR